MTLYPVLATLFSVAALSNAFLFFTGGHDFDKLVIAVLFLALAINAVSDFYDAKARR